MGKTKIKATILVAIMILAFLSAASIVKGATSTPTLSSDNEKAAKSILDKYYIQTLGLSQNVTSIDSSIVIANNETTIGYVYVGNFTCGKLHYTVATTTVRTTTDKNAVLDTAQTISGSPNCTIGNSTVSAHAIQTNLGTETKNVIHYSQISTNLTGNYRLNLNADIFTGSPIAITSKPTTVTGPSAIFSPTGVLSGTATLDENSSGPVGTYKATFGNGQNGSIASALITTPDGNTAILNAAPATATDLPTDYSSTASNVNNISPMVDTYNPPPGYGWGIINPTSENGYTMAGGYVWWASGISVIAGVVSAIIGLILAAIAFISGGTTLAIVGAIMAGIGWALAEGAIYVAQMNGPQGNFSVTILYIEFMFWMLLGVIPLPVYAEIGYYSNYYNYPGYWNNWNLWPIEVPWTYYDCFDTAHGSLAPPDTILSFSHTDLLPRYQPPDPKIQVLAYDESTGSYVDNIPICLDGVWIPTSTLNDYSLPDGAHVFQAGDSGGAVDYLSDGSNNYGNPATITLTDNSAAVIAYYHYIPSYTVTFDAYGYDNFNGNYQLNTDVYVDGNCVGVSPMSVQIPLGFHSIGVDDPLYGNCETFTLNMLVGNNGYNFQSEPITSGMSITAYYYPQGYYG